ncbi:MAG: hypothetical protein ACO1OD_11650 [Croceibacterium sp.]
MVSRRAKPLIGAVTLFAGVTPAQAGPAAAQTGVANETEAADNEIVVTGFRDIVVNGRAIRCRPVAGDPLDDVDLGGGFDVDPHSRKPVLKHMAIIPDGQNGYVMIPNNEQITGPEFWQRVGVGMDRYVFRAPSIGRPMCIGGRSDRDRFAGFRRVVDAASYRGHRLRFTAWVATGRAEQVNFWLAAGTQWPEKRREFEVRRTDFYELLNGGNTNNLPFGGNHDWTPVLLETGPINKDADHVSYGFNLQGSGDVWVYEPRLEIVVDPSEGQRASDLVVMVGDQR